MMCFLSFVTPILMVFASVNSKSGVGQSLRLTAGSTHNCSVKETTYHEMLIYVLIVAMEVEYTFVRLSNVRSLKM